jgi:hypothetical protein
VFHAPGNALHERHSDIRMSHYRAVALVDLQAGNSVMFSYREVSQILNAHRFASRIVGLCAVAVTVPRRRLSVGRRARPEAATTGPLAPRDVLFLLVLHTPILKPDLHLQRESNVEECRVLVCYAVWLL